MNNKASLVSIGCVTYNHEFYIRDALNSFLMQKTTFPIEILIHDDASTDKTADIIREYEKKHPDIIKSIYQKENQYSKRVGISVNYQFPRARGKYIALCEGDDYWTDPYKLQKQVDFLEANPEYVLCFHNVFRKYENLDRADELYNSFSEDLTLTKQDLLLKNHIATVSVVFRNIPNIVPDWASDLPAGDYPLWCALANQGEIRYLNETMAVYRIHGRGIWSSKQNKDHNDLTIIRRLLKHETNLYYQNILKKRFIELNISLMYRLNDVNSNDFKILLDNLSEFGETELLNQFPQIFTRIFKQKNTIHDLEKELQNILKSKTFNILNRVNKIKLRILNFIKYDRS